MTREGRYSRPGMVWLLALSLLAVPGAAAAQGTRGLKPDARADEQAGVRVEVVPRPTGEGQPVEFELYFNTHSEDLAFDVLEVAVLEVAVLEDAEAETFRALSWEGSPPGGHHRSGRLVFPPVPEGRYLKLTLRGIAGVDRVFEWGEGEG